MTKSQHPLSEVLENDPRYGVEAYQFVRDGLTYAQEILLLGSDQPALDGEEGELEKHLTGQQLCEAIREYALDQYGLMVIPVLKQWGITCTSDFGNIVYNLIDAQLMKRSQHDRREDFDDVYSFDQAFRDDFRIRPENNSADREA